jgi:hypothetical protein
MTPLATHLQSALEALASAHAVLEQRHLADSTSYGCTVAQIRAAIDLTRAAKIWGEALPVTCEEVIPPAVNAKGDLVKW